jgi:hypothetical protein
VRPLNDDERRLAAVTAHTIAKAHEAGLPDAPDKLVPPSAILSLARAHLELIDRVEKLHVAVGDLEKLAEVRRSLQDQVQSIQGRVDEIARVAIEAALGEVARQQGGIASEQIAKEAQSEGLLAAKTLVSTYVNTTPNARRHAFPSGADAQLRVVPPPAGVAKLSEPDLLTIYCLVMRETKDVFLKYESYVVRQWDGMDGCWTDCTGAVERFEALRYWAERTSGGTHHVAYAEIDYYRIFPGGTRMTWDGSEGREMHR